jgi:hypothetical protein
MKAFDPCQEGVSEPIPIKDTIGLYNGTVRAESIKRALHNRRGAISIGVVIGDNNDMPPLKDRRAEIEGSGMERPIGGKLRYLLTDGWG